VKKPIALEPDIRSGTLRFIYSGYSLNSNRNASLLARLASVAVTKKTFERSIALFLPARWISHCHGFGGGALFLTTTEKSSCSIMGKLPHNIVHGAKTLLLRRSSITGVDETAPGGGLVSLLEKR